MILQALYNYYDRLNDPQDNILAPIGFEDREIGFVIVIDRNGRFLEIEDFNNSEGGVQEFRVVQYMSPLQKPHLFDRRTVSAIVLLTASNP